MLGIGFGYNNTRRRREEERACYNDVKYYLNNTKMTRSQIAKKLGISRAEVLRVEQDLFARQQIRKGNR